MSMTGVHGLGGLAMAVILTWFVKSRYDVYSTELLGIAAFGFVLGQFLPDVDFLLTVPVYPIDAQLAEALHRSFTHSFVMAGVVAIVGLILYYRRSKESGTFTLALSGGVTMHTIQDIPFWFESLALFWPVFHILEGEPRWFGIWAGNEPGERPGTVQALSTYQPPDNVASVIFSWEYGSIAVFLAVLFVLATRLGTNQEYLSRLKLYTGLYLGLFVLALALIPFFDHGTHTEIIWGPSPILWLLVIWITLQMRETIEAFGQAGLGAVRESRF